jgi:tetratricopeptide (TPR) repeat protein
MFFFILPSFSQNNQALDYRMQGFKAQKSGDDNAAIEFYEKAIAADPTYATPYNDMGIIFQRQGNLDAAEKRFLTALQIKPDYAGVYTNLALLYEERGDVPRALAYWEKRAAMGDSTDPYVPKALENIARLQALPLPASALIPEKIEPIKEEIKTSGSPEFASKDEFYAQRENLMQQVITEVSTVAGVDEKDVKKREMKVQKASEIEKERSEKARIKKLVARAKKDMYNEQYQDALDKLYEVRTLDDKVKYLDDLIDEARSRSIDFELARASMNSDLYKKAQLLEVENAWYPPVPDVKPIEGYTENFAGVKKSPARLDLERKSKEIIPKIDFKQAQLKEVIEFLAVSSSINIVIDETVVPRNETVTIHLTNIPLEEALDIILRTKGLKYRFEENIIWITTQEKLLEEDLVVEVYDVQDLVGKLFDFPSKPFEFKPTVKQEAQSS